MRRQEPHFPVSKRPFGQQGREDQGKAAVGAQVHELQQRDPAWLTNGQWGVIQFVPGMPDPF
jgi:hypothetical protein